MYRLILHILTRAQLRSCLTPWWHFPTTRKIVNHEDSQFKLGSTVYPVNKVAGMPSIQFWHTKIDSRQILNFSIWSINYNYYQHCLLELLSGNWTWQWTGPKMNGEFPIARFDWRGVLEGFCQWFRQLQTPYETLFRLVFGVRLQLLRGYLEYWRVFSFCVPVTLQPY